MTAIYKREIQSFFHSFIGWLYLAASLLILGIFFTAYNMLAGYPNIAGILISVVFLFLLTVPILTMRSLAEDRKLKTDQLILTAPVKIGNIVLGKYLALLTFYAIPLLILGITPLILSRYDTFQMGISYTALLGFFLYDALALAVGLFLSSLTESIVIAAVLTFVVLFLGYLMSGICSLISQTGNLLTKVLSAFDMVGRFDEMANGSFYVPSVVYYISFILLMLFFTVQSIQKRRYQISGKGFKIGAYSVGMIVVTTILTVLVNLLVNQLPEEYLSLDVTSNKMYTITEDTKAFVAGMSEDVTIYVLVNEEHKDGNFDKTIQKIGDLSKHITISYVDPSVNPRFYSSYTSTQPTDNSLIVVGSNRSRVVDYGDVYTYEIDYTTYSYQTTGYDGEGQITSALAYVTSDDMPKVYIITGHGELELEGQYRLAIQKENVEYEELSLFAADKIPEDAQAIIMDAPTSDYSADDVEKVLAFLESGGNAIVIPTLTEEKLINFEKILEYFGVSLVDGMIIEGDMGMYYNNPFYQFPAIAYDEMTSAVYGAAVFAPYAQGLSYDVDSDDVVYTLLLESSEDSYSKINLQTATDYAKEDGDIDGPFAVALKAEKPVENNEISRVFITATEELFTEEADMLVPGNNVKLFSGVISSLVEHQSSVTIPVKYYDASLIVFPVRTCIIVGVISIILIPLCCLLCGFVIWFKRRRQ